MTDPDPDQTGRDAALIAESLNLVASRGDDLIALFYDQLFDRHPEVRALFPADMTEQRERLLKAVVDVVTSYARRDDLLPTLHELGARHVGYGARPEHYPIVGGVLLDSLATVAGPAWTHEYEQVWTRMFTFVSDAMLAGATAGTAA